MARRVTLTEAVYHRMEGIHKTRAVVWLRTGQVVAFVQAWSVVEAKLGRQPTLAEYRDYWKQPRRSATREQQRFREAFPEYETPSDLIAAGVEVQEKIA